MDSRGVVIVGAGHAGGEFAVRLRQNGYAAPVTILGAESHLPYQRPPLSKSFLSGSLERDALLLRPAASYRDLSITVRSDVTVTAIDRDRHEVTTHQGVAFGYDALVLATGGRARRLSCPGAALANVFCLRTIDDVESIRAALRPGCRLVLIGGGYVGLEVAAVAVKAGVDVTVVEAAPRLLARVTGAQVSAFYEQAHRAAGVAVHTGTSVVALHPVDAETSGHVGAVELADGRRIAADVVIVGIGLIPNTELAEQAGLAVDNGIMVDEYGRTDDPAILAIGDCCNQPNLYSGRRLRLESVPNAVEQGRVAAGTLTGKLSASAAVPWFWSDQYDLKLQAVGLMQADDETVLRGDPERHRFVAFYLRNGKLVAADAVNRPADFMVAKRLVAEGAEPAPALLADESIALKSLLPRAAAA